MKILIVDDEQHVIKAINYLINWEDYPSCEIFEASNGVEATEIIKKEGIHIVFTDMQMPKMDGLALLRWIQDNTNHTQIIAISNHSNFEYVQQVVRSGGIDYILKPIDPVQLNEAFGKAIDAVQKASKISKDMIKVNTYTPIYYSKLLSDIITNNTFTRGQLKQISDHFGITNKDMYQLLLVQIPDLDEFAKQLFQNDKSLLFYSLNNVCNEIINEDSGFSFRYLNSENEVVILYWGDKNNIYTKLQGIKEWLNKLYNITPIMGMSNRYKDLSKIKSCYDEAKLALINRNVNSHSDIQVWTYRKLNYQIPVDELINHLTKKLPANLKLLKPEIIRTVLSDFEKSFIQYPYIRLKDLVAVYDAFIASFQLRYKEIELEDHDAFDTIESLVNSMENVLTNTMTSYKQTTDQSNLIDDTLTYIQNHYTQNITLSYLADYFYVSKEHLSRSFKKKVGQTISEYITLMKMEQAKHLLKHSNRTIKEISGNVGYQDEKYFSKVFKKHYNCSPKEFRE
ncbi:response regulator transcription factor [Vallitalea okinawensis]|uniref:response regulator transcription factor n=1 Tax=Vallitalea okinawensis TaxID=2078660 RepID=UPI000CFBC343|nr:response regulator [Vallitalea okinawensis]